MRHAPSSRSSTRSSSHASPLTASGAGLLLEKEDASDPGFQDRVRALLDSHRFVVVRAAHARLQDAVETMRRFGPINEAKTRTEGAVLVEAKGDQEVFRSNAALPLHKDGLLTGFDVLLVGIYCVAFEDVRDGRTYVSDANLALRELPPEDLTLLRENGSRPWPWTRRATTAASTRAPGTASRPSAPSPAGRRA